MAKGGFNCEAAGNAAYFTPLLEVMVIKNKIASTKQDMFILWYFLTALWLFQEVLEQEEVSELFDKELQAFMWKEVKWILY